MADGARTAGARIVAALLRSPGHVGAIVERTGCDTDTVQRWMLALEAQGAAVRRGNVRVHPRAWAVVWALNLGER